MSIRVGILGNASIARRSLIPAFTNHPDYSLVGVASRAGAISYDEMISRPDVDLIYCPLPTGLHYEWVKKALLVGKHVLCEKSLGCNASEVEDLVATARARHCFLMESFQFRFHAQNIYVKRLLAQNAIGELRQLLVRFGIPPFPEGEKNIRYHRELGGGALLDNGAYTIKATTYLLGRDVKVLAALAGGGNIIGGTIPSVDLTGSLMLTATLPSIKCEEGEDSDTLREASPCSPCSTWTKTPGNVIHVDRVEHVESDTSCAASPCSPCFTWTKTPGNVIHGERVEHVESDTLCEASPCSQCSTWTKPSGNVIHGERVEHVEGEREASPCSTCSTWTEKTGNVIHVERVEHVESDTSCEASPCSPCSTWTKPSGNVIHGERVEHVEIDTSCEASPCSPRTKIIVPVQTCYGFDHFYQNGYELWGTEGKIATTRAFTARSDYAAPVILETKAGREVKTFNDDHFARLLDYVSTTISTGDFETEYRECLLQSQLLESARLVSKIDSTGK